MNLNSPILLILSYSTTLTLGGDLYRFIAPEHLPVEYGGLRRNNDQDFSADDKVFEHKIKANTVSTVEFPVNEVLNIKF